MADGEVELVVGPVDIGRADHHGLHRAGDLLRVGPAQDLGVALHPACGEIDLLRVAVEHFSLGDRPVACPRIGCSAGQEADLADPRLIGGLEQQGIDQDVGSDVDEGGGSDGCGARSVGRTYENGIHAFDGLGAVFRSPQIGLDNLGSRNVRLKRPEMGSEPQLCT